MYYKRVGVGLGRRELAVVIRLTAFVVCEYDLGFRLWSRRWELFRR